MFLNYSKPLSAKPACWFRTGLSLLSHTGNHRHRTAGRVIRVETETQAASGGSRRRASGRARARTPRLPAAHTGTHHAHAPLAVEGNQRGVVEVPVRQARSAAFEVQVYFIGCGIEYRRSCDSADVLNTEKRRWHFRKFTVPQNCKNYTSSVRKRSSG